MQSPLDADMEQIALLIERLGLTTPTIFFLEMHRPLRGISATVLQGFAPLAGTMFGAERIGQLERVLAQPDVVDTLIARLERGAAHKET